MMFSFVAGVVLVTLATSHLIRFQRTVVLLSTSIALMAAYAALGAGIAYGPAILLAVAMGGAHCVFERDNPKFQEAMSPSTQITRFGEALAGGRAGNNPRQIGLHASFWLAFLAGGIAGASAWVALGGRAFALMAGLAILLALRSWVIERDLLPA